MLVLTRRAGDSLFIGDTIEVKIVDVDWMDLETRCAIQVTDDDGNELSLRGVKTREGAIRIIES